MLQKDLKGCSWDARFIKSLMFCNRTFLKLPYTSGFLFTSIKRKLFKTLQTSDLFFNIKCRVSSLFKSQGMYKASLSSVSHNISCLH